jgi:GT2 family glycosyltransferase
MKVSVIIPTYNHLEDFLRPCINSIIKNTKFEDVEVIIVANGCTDGTEEYLRTLKETHLWFNYLWFDQAIGYTKAVNEGIKIAVGECVVLMNNDLLILNDSWLPLLLAPMTDPFVGLVGPSKFSCRYGEITWECLSFWLVAIRKELFDKLGLLDEVFSPGMGEDGDFCIKAKIAGYALVGVPEDVSAEFGTGHARSNFPVFHHGSGTFKSIIDKSFYDNNTKILENRYSKKIKISVVIPTYNHLEDCLKPCIDSVLVYTDFYSSDLDIEIIIVANGCTDGTHEYLNDLKNQYSFIKPLFFENGLGFSKATNEGLKVATGDYLLLLNNDIILLNQKQNVWLRELLIPFLKYDNMGVTGSLILHDGYAAHLTIIFFCALISRKLFNVLGLLDEVYGMGGGEDIDYCVRAVKAGFQIMQVPEGVQNELGHDAGSNRFINVGPYPIYHKGEGTMDDIPEYGRYVIKENGLKNMLKYHPDIKLNLGSGGVDFDGYFSVDLHDSRAHLCFDVTDLSRFADNSISSIIASHIFEHINPWKAIDVLKEWRRVLKPGATLIMELPDIERLCKRFLEANKAERYGVLNAIYGATNTHQSANDPNYDRTNISSPHMYGWWPELLWDHLVWAGWDPNKIKFGAQQIIHPGDSNFRCEATK